MIGVSLDSLLDKRKSDEYTCLDHACEAWKLITGDDLRVRIQSYINTGRLSLEDARGFDQLSRADSPCIVLMDHHVTSDPHMGIYYDYRVLHLADHGAEYMPLSVATVGFTKVRFYQPCA